jgi:hypothetical protein
MTAPRNLCAVAVALVGTVFAGAGCGGRTNRSTAQAVTPTAPSHSASHYSSQVTQSGRSIGPGTIVLRRLGTIHFRCAGPKGITAVLDPHGVLATESAYVEDGGHRHLRAETIQPGTAFAATNPSSRSELWHLIQSTEPETLDARITITVEPDCAGQWRARVGVISHAGAWSPPQPWL